MDTITVTNNLLHMAYSKKDDDDLSPLRVQKLLYFVHGWYLAITGAALLTEPFVRGPYGPLLVSLEAELRGYGSLPVGDYIKQWDMGSGKYMALFVNMAAYPDLSSILGKVWEQYRRFSTAQLSTLSHSDTSPWAQTAPGQPINNELIRQSFLQMVRDRRQADSLEAAP
jgi:uncharacterized phage-associated protein